LVNEVMKDVLTEAMDIDGLKRVLRDMNEGRIRCVAVDTPVPSQFSHEILNANPYAYLDDAPLEERRARAVEMRRILPESVLEEVGKLDPAAIEQVREEAWPDVRDADELHDVLHTLIAFPISDLSSHSGHVGTGVHARPAERDSASSVGELGLARADVDVRAHMGLAGPGWQSFFERLAGTGRAVSAFRDGKQYWVATERAKVFVMIFPDAAFETIPAEARQTVSEKDDAVLAMVTGWMGHLGPVTATALSGLLGISAGEIEKALLRLEASGAILRGNFTGRWERPANEEANETSGIVELRSTGRARAPVPTWPQEWCDRRLLARIHRLTVATLRKQIEPVTPAQFMRWLLRWQNVAPGSQMQGERATLEVLRRLQGFEIPANAWERQVLSRRIADYDPKWLDQLCLTGAVGWGRLSPHPATLDSSNGQQ